MPRVTAEQFAERWDTLPIPLRELLCSPSHGKLVWSTGAAHHLSDEKSGVVAGVVGDIIMGFIHANDLAREIGNRLDLNQEIASSIAREIDQKILSPFKEEILKNYNPIVEEGGQAGIATRKIGVPANLAGPATETPGTKTISLKELLEEKPTPVPVSGEGAPPREGPLIIHTEKPLAEEARKSAFKGFSLPLIGFFKPKTEEAAAPVKAEVETPDAKKKEVPRTVHYSELRTPLSPFGEGEELINLETFERFAAPPPVQPKPEPTAPARAPEAPATAPEEKPPIPVLGKFFTPPAAERHEPPAAPPTPTAPAPAMESAPERTEPKLEGNVVNLRSSSS